MKVGDLVKCKTVPAYGLIMKIDRHKPAFGYQQRYWVLICGKKITFPFMEHQLDVI
jgi:hypothetical protein